MWIAVTRFVSLFFTAIALSAGMAHLLELPNKSKLSKEQYSIGQQIYRGWSLLGIVVVVAIISAFALVIMVGDQPKAFALTLTALLSYRYANSILGIHIPC